MKKEESWIKFEKTGAVIEYLNYTACTREEKLGCKKEIKNDPDGYGNRNCVVNDANR